MYTYYIVTIDDDVDGFWIMYILPFEYYYLGIRLFGTVRRKRTRVVTTMFGLNAKSYTLRLHIHIVVQPQLRTIFSKRQDGYNINIIIYNVHIVALELPKVLTGSHASRRRRRRKNCIICVSVRCTVMSVL